MNSFVSLMYHNVVEDGTSFPQLSPSVTSYFVDRSTFATHMRLIEQVARFIDCIEMKQCFQSPENDGESAKPRKPIQITFDDGWLGSFEVAEPFFARLGAEGIVFVTTDLIGSRHFIDEANLQRFPNQYIRIGSHGKTHRMLNQLSDFEIHEELVYSKKQLEDLTGHEIDMISIPGGAVDDRVEKLTFDVGYRFLFTSEIHKNPHTRGTRNIGRVAIRNTTTITDVERYARHNLRREQFRRGLLSIPKRLLGQECYAALRRRLLGESEDQHEMLALCTEQESSNGENTSFAETQILELQETARP